MRTGARSEASTDACNVTASPLTALVPTKKEQHGRARDPSLLFLHMPSTADAEKATP